MKEILRKMLRVQVNRLSGFHAGPPSELYILFSLSSLWNTPTPLLVFLMSFTHPLLFGFPNFQLGSIYLPSTGPQLIFWGIPLIQLSSETIHHYPVSLETPSLGLFCNLGEFMTYSILRNTS